MNEVNTIPTNAPLRRCGAQIHRKFLLYSVFLILMSLVLPSVAGSESPPPGPAPSVNATEVERSDSLFSMPVPGAELDMMRPSHPPIDQIPPMPMPAPRDQITPDAEGSGDGIMYDPILKEETRVPADAFAPLRDNFDEVVRGGGYRGVDGGLETPNDPASMAANMTRITNTGSDPWRMNAKLVMRFGSAFFVCSGTMRDAETVLTAGHCIHNQASGGWADEVWVYPGWDGNSESSQAGPYGWGRSKYLGSVTGWTNNANVDFDFGVVGITRAVGMLTGWFGSSYGGSCSWHTGTTYHNASYPAQACDQPGLHNGRDMYYWYGNFDSCPGNQLQINTSPGCFSAVWGGMSGSGAYHMDAGNRFVHGIASTSNRSTWGRYVRQTEGWVNLTNGTFIPAIRGATFDLQALDMNAQPATIQAGGSTTLLNHLAINPTNGTRNQSFTFRVYLSTNDVISSADTLLSTQSYSRNFGAMSSVRVNMAQVTIPANTPAGNYWLGVEYDCATTDANCNNNATNGWDAVRVTVTAAPTRTLTVNSSGASGVTITANPSAYGGTTNYSRTGIPNGTSITLTAPATAGGANFSSWSGCASTANRNCTVSMTQNRTVTANYTTSTTYTLTVNSSGASGVAITANPSAYGGTTNYSRTGIASGTSITLTAPATAGGANFSSWSGCASTANRNCTVSMTQNRTVTANYTTSTTYTLTVNSSGATGVPITANPSAYGGTTNYSVIVQPPSSGPMPQNEEAENDGRPSQKGTLTPRWTPPAPPRTTVMPWQSSEYIELKFREGTSYRLRDSRLTSPPGLDDVSRLDEVFRQHPVMQIQRLFSESESALDDAKSILETQTGKQMPDLNLWFRLRVDPGTDIEALIDALNALPEVEIAYPAPLPAPPPRTPDSNPQSVPLAPPPPTTPNFVPQQGYLQTAPTGIDAVYAWSLAGGTGNQVTVVDIEYDFNANHEDLPNVQLVSGALWGGFGDDHGTAVLGQLVGKANSFGVTGIAHGAVAKFASPCSSASGCGYNLANAINAARTATVAGDVILLEQQTPVCGTPEFGPVEETQSVYDAILVATASGRHVVQAAGNGAVNLDSTGCQDRFNRANRDSGAIIVGAGAPPGHSQTQRSRLDFSTYGSRVDLQGWGRLVVTTGYGNLYTGTGKNQWYTNTFSGTSSASPIVAGAVALLSSIGQQSGTLHSPAWVRSRLVSTGSAQQAAPGFPVSQNIGPLPNVRAALPGAASITLTAPATASGANFSSWSGCASTANRNCTVVMTQNRTVTVNYTSTPCPYDDHRVLQNTTVTGPALYGACRTLAAGPGFVVSASGDATFRAGQRITLRPGFRVQAGGRFRAQIHPSLAAAAAPQARHAAPAAASTSIAPPWPPATALTWSDLPTGLRTRLRERDATVRDAQQSADGDLIVFATDAALVAEDANGHRDVYAYAAAADALWLISATPRGAAGAGPSHSPRLDGEGRHVIYLSTAPDLVAGPSNDHPQLYHHDLDLGATARLTRTAAGRPGAGASDQPLLAGPWAIYRTEAPDLAPEGPGLYRQHLHDGRREAVGLDDGGLPDPRASHPAADAAGDQIAYQRPDPDERRQIYLTALPWVERLSRADDPDLGPLDHCCAALSADGRYLVYREQGSEGPAWLHLRDRARSEYVRLPWPADPALAEQAPRFHPDTTALEWLAPEQGPDLPEVRHRLHNPLREPNAR